MTDLGIDGLGDVSEIGSGSFATAYVGFDEGFARRVTIIVKAG